MKTLVKYLSAVALGICSFTTMQAADPYKVRVRLTEDEEGMLVKLINFDTKDQIDSAVVNSKVALFKGEIDEPIMGRLTIDGQPVATFVLESGSIVVDPEEHKVFGSMTNDLMQSFNVTASDLSSRYRQADNDSVRQNIYDEYTALVEKTLTDNIDNPFGYYLFVDEANSMTPEEFEGWLTRYPELGNYQRVVKIKESQAKKAATGVGRMFSDFEVTYDGKTQKLSDYVGHGKYVLVDYWASWCGPCLRQIPVIKELLAEFGDKGLEVLGVAVWDEPEATIKAIGSHGITWPCIIDAKTIPTDIYGINGIPCIILYGPDGTILSRDKQGDELKADVRAAFAE